MGLKPLWNSVVGAADVIPTSMISVYGYEILEQLKEKL
jgi:hypothetical protein